MLASEKRVAIGEAAEAIQAAADKVRGLLIEEPAPRSDLDRGARLAAVLAVLEQQRHRLLWAWSE